jgi:hypothetical protein
LPARHLLTPCFHPKVENVVQVQIRKQRRNDSPYAKGNLTFERRLKYR